MALQPESLGNDLIDRMNALISQGGEIDQFTARRLYADAEKVPNAPMRFNVKGMIACVLGEYDDMRSYHLNALRLENSVFSNLNFANSLFNAGFYEESFDYDERALNISPDDLEVLGPMIDHRILACRFEDVARLLGRWNSLNLGKRHPNSDFIAFMTNAIRRFGLTDKDFSDVVLKARKFIHSKGIKRIKYAFLPSEIEEGATDIRLPIFCSFGVARSIDEASAINMDLAEHIASEANKSADVMLYRCVALPNQ